MHSKYPNLFGKFCCSVNFDDEIFIRGEGCNANLEAVAASRSEASARAEASTDTWAVASEEDDDCEGASGSL